MECTKTTTDSPHQHPKGETERVSMMAEMRNIPLLPKDRQGPDYTKTNKNKTINLTDGQKANQKGFGMKRAE